MLNLDLFPLQSPCSPGRNQASIRAQRGPVTSLHLVFGMAKDNQTNMRTMVLVYKTLHEWVIFRANVVKYSGTMDMFTRILIAQLLDLCT